MSRFLYELFYGTLYFKSNDTEVIVILTSKLIIIEGCQNIIADFAASVKLFSSYFSVVIL